MTEIPRHVIRICGELEVPAMALEAIRVHELIVVVDVARLAVKPGMIAD